MGSRLCFARLLWSTKTDGSLEMKRYSIVTGIKPTATTCMPLLQFTVRRIPITKCTQKINSLSWRFFFRTKNIIFESKGRYNWKKYSTLYSLFYILMHSFLLHIYLHMHDACMKTWILMFVCVCTCIILCIYVVYVSDVL